MEGKRCDFLWCLADIAKKVFLLLLLGHSFLGPLAKEPGFSWSFLVCAYFGPGLETSAASCSGYVRGKKKIQQTNCWVFPQVLDSQPSFNLSETSCAHLFCHIYAFLVVRRRTWKKWGILILVKLKVIFHFSIKSVHLCYLNGYTLAFTAIIS